ncbi:hypothetical protein F5H01DRAFT_359146 [Linnemannia elongata]|nr:hypothetical protein F5H01DRAFT_359146 [Linnemannia elongata]
MRVVVLQFCILFSNSNSQARSFSGLSLRGMRQAKPNYSPTCTCLLPLAPSHHSRPTQESTCPIANQSTRKDSVLQHLLLMSIFLSARPTQPPLAANRMCSQVKAMFRRKSSSLSTLLFFWT